MRACYARASILALPTLSDEWGLVVNEAMAAGMPVLGSVYSQAVEDLCVEGQNGWRFRPDAPGEIDAAIERALATPPDELEAMRNRARETVEHLTPEYVADRFVDAIRAALALAAGLPDPTNPEPHDCVRHD